jgi:hypothetical protein
MSEISPPKRRCTKLTVSDDGHVPDVGRPVHELTDLRDGEAVEIIVSFAMFIRRRQRQKSRLNGKRGRDDLLDHLDGVS